MQRRPFGRSGLEVPVLGFGAGDRPRDAVTLQAVSAVGQSRLMGVYDEALSRHGLVAGQVLSTRPTVTHTGHLIRVAKFIASMYREA
mgnify:CR=1 FL=1